jgi:hypothetical protein
LPFHISFFYVYVPKKRVQIPSIFLCSFSSSLWSRYVTCGKKEINGSNYKLKKGCNVSLSSSSLPLHCTDNCASPSSTVRPPSLSPPVPTTLAVVPVTSSPLPVRFKVDRLMWFYLGSLRHKPLNLKIAETSTVNLNYSFFPSNCSLKLNLETSFFLAFFLSLDIVSTYRVGLDKIDLKKCREKGIQPDVLIYDVAVM